MASPRATKYNKPDQQTEATLPRERPHRSKDEAPDEEFDDEPAEEFDSPPLFDGVVVDAFSSRSSFGRGSELSVLSDLDPNFSVNCGINVLMPKNTPPTINSVIRKREKGVKRLIVFYFFIRFMNNEYVNLSNRDFKTELSGSWLE